MRTVRTTTILVLIAAVAPVILLSPFLELSEHLTQRVPEVDELSLGVILALCLALACRKAVSYFLRVALRNGLATTRAFSASEHPRVMPSLSCVVVCRFIALCDLRI